MQYYIYTHVHARHYVCTYVCGLTLDYGHSTISPPPSLLWTAITIFAKRVLARGTKVLHRGNRLSLGTVWYVHNVLF